MIPSQLVPSANHLWQSTLFVGVVGLLTLFLKKNRAHVRYWLWFLASVKFLLPFSILVAVGGLLGRHTAAAVAPSRLVSAAGFSSFVEQVGEPFTTTVPQFAMPAVQRSYASVIVAVLILVWAAGFVTLVCRWTLRWRRIRASVRKAFPLDLPIGLPVKSSPAFGEPGVFGIFRPVLLLPEKIMDCLTAREMESIVAHELCHVRRRDNLATVLHMAVEVVFWFHPLVWWLGARLMEERERACDEEVLRNGGEPRAYAEGILKICELYLSSPLACVAGVTGGDLKRRIEAIMSNRAARRLNYTKKAILAVAATAAVLTPIVVGITNTPAIRAQSSQSAPSPRPKFEVASIKRCTVAASEDMARSGGRSGGGVLGDPGMFRTPCVTVRALIEGAYIRYADGQGRPLSMLKKQPLQGGPDWIDSDRYSVDAKPESPQTRAMMGGPMLQSLLEERFKLKIHRATKEVPVYTLVVAKGGAKLQATKEGGCTPGDPHGPPPPIVPGQPLPCGYIDGDKDGVKAVGVSIESLCTILSHQFRRDVIDKTGLTGLFDYHLDVVMGPPGTAPAEDDANALDVVTVGLQKLGLKLEQAKGTAEIVVIDHIEKPSAN